MIHTFEVCDKYKYRKVSHRMLNDKPNHVECITHKIIIQSLWEQFMFGIYNKQSNVFLEIVQ